VRIDMAQYKVWYEVQPGDTIESIAKHLYGENSRGKDLAKFNGIYPPYSLKTGQKIIYPTSGEKTTSDRIDSTSFVLPPQDYISQRFDKTQIVLHFTAGSNFAGAFQTFQETGRVATPYILDTDGEIYQIFDPDMWAYHLGVKGSNGGYDRKSIGIEIVNVGALKLQSQSRLCWWPKDWNQTWATLDQKDRYTDLGSPDIKGIQYYATFTDAQYDSTKYLLTYLCETYGIPYVFPHDKRHMDLNMCDTFSGILAHEHYRYDKFDMGGSWNWERITQ
jgi:N-acetyl-anhydromuramyl-L-alanine amidase AmpD